MLAGKGAPGERCEEKITVKTNVFAVVPSENVRIFRYDVRVLEEYNKKDGQSVFKEATKQNRNEYVCLSFRLRLFWLMI